MKDLELIAYKRTKFGKRNTKRLRNEGNVPCVIYGKEILEHCYVPMILFRELIYTPNIYMINLDIEGDIHRCILQDFQIHPVSEIILHVDFLKVSESEPIKMNVPIRHIGDSPGLQKGGKLIPKLRYIHVKALPSHIPDAIEVNVSTLDLGKTVKIKDLPKKEYTILNNPRIPIVSVEIPRALKSTESTEKTEMSKTEP